VAGNGDDLPYHASQIVGLNRVELDRISMRPSLVGRRLALMLAGRQPLKFSVEVDECRHILGTEPAHVCLLNCKLVKVDADAAFGGEAFELLFE